MKKILFSLLCITFFSSFVYATTTYVANTENGHAYKVMKVILDGRSKIVVSTVNNGSTAQSLQTLMQNLSGNSAINGGFFCPNESSYSRCTGNTTDLVRKSNGILYSKRGRDIGSNKSVFGFDASGIPAFVSDDGTYKEDMDVDGIFNGIGMPTLVKGGVNVAVFNDAMNKDAKQGKAGNKSFICSTQDNSAIYMGYVDGVTFSSIADYLITTFNCYNAIQLDNGGSKAMIVNNNYVTGPGRNIMDAFVVVEGANVGPVLTQELQTAIAWMNGAGLTKYNTIDDFLPYNTMSRQEAAKFFSVFAKAEFNKDEDATLICNFNDILSADSTLTNNIISACKLGIFRGYNGNFLPKDKLNNAQAITVLMRVIVGMLPEPSTAFYANYLAKAQEFGLVGNIAVNNNITRGEAAVLLYKAHLYKQAH